MVKQVLNIGQIGAITGGTLAIGSDILGDLKPFLGALVNWASGASLVQGSSYYFTDDGQGALSASLAFQAGLWISEGILSTEARRDRLPQSFGGPYKVSKEYAELKKKYGYGSLYGRLTGTLGSSITAIKNPGGGFIVGVRPNAPVIEARGGLNDTSIPVSTYAAILEYSKNRKRPLITPLMGAWLQREFPVWGKSFDSYWRSLFDVKVTEANIKSVVKGAKIPDKPVATTTKFGASGVQVVDTAKSAEDLASLAQIVEQVGAAFRNFKKGDVPSNERRRTLTDLMLKAYENSGGRITEKIKDQVQTVFMNPKALEDQDLVTRTLQYLSNLG